MKSNEVFFVIDTVVVVAVVAVVVLVVDLKV
jgi:hypothetical protein